MTTPVDASAVYPGLGTDLGRCYRVVGIHPGPRLGPPVLAAALGVEVDTAQEWMDGLVAHGLLTVRSRHHYQLPGPVAAHARQLGRCEKDRTQVLQDMGLWYLAMTRAADSVVTGYRRRPPADADALLGTVPFACRAAALDWLLRERPNLVALVQTLAAAEPQIAALIGDAMWPLFLYCGYPDERAIVDQAMIESAQALDNPGWTSDACRRWALQLCTTGRLDEAEHLARKALELAGEDPYRQAGAVEVLGLVASQRGDITGAAEGFRRELHLYEQAHAEREQALALAHLGRTATAAGQHNQAVADLGLALHLMTGLHEPNRDVYNTARIRALLGEALTRTGQPERGNILMRQALSAMTYLGTPRGQLLCYLALARSATGNPHTAATYLHHAWALAQQIGTSDTDRIQQMINQVGGVPAAQPGA